MMRLACPGTRLHQLGMRGRAAYRWAQRRLVAMAETQKWEYATVPLIVHATKQILAQWGEDGWELVQGLVNPDSGGLVAYLKRPAT